MKGLWASLFAVALPLSGLCCTCKFSRKPSLLFQLAQIDGAAADPHPLATKKGTTKSDVEMGGGEGGEMGPAEVLAVADPALQVKRRLKSGTNLISCL